MFCASSLSHVQLFATLWTVTYRLLCPWGFYRQEYWGGLPCPPPGDLPNPGIKPRFPALQVDSFLCEAPGKPKNTGVGTLSLLQGIFPTQESKGSPALQVILYQLSYQESPHIMYMLWIFYVTGGLVNKSCPILCIYQLNLSYLKFHG